MMARKPIALGVRGEASEIVEEAGAGIQFTPEDASALLEAVVRLQHDKNLYEAIATSGFNFVRLYHDRKKIARNYWELLQKVAAGKPILGSQSSKEIAI